MVELKPEAKLPRDQLDAVFKLFRRASRFWWVVLIATVIGTPVAIVASKLRKDVYTSYAVVQYQEGMNFLGSQDQGPSARRMGLRLRESLLARVNLAKLIEETGLGATTRDLDQAKLVETVRSAIGFRVNEGDTFVISFGADKPRKAQEVTAKITELLIEENKRMRAESAEIAREFLDAERMRTEENLRAKDTEVARFLAKHPEFAQEGSGAAVTALRKKPNEPVGDTVLAALRREEARLRQQIANPNAAVVTPSVPQDPVLQAAIREAEGRVAAARRDLADKRGRFTEQHPDVRAAATVLKQAEDALKKLTDSAAEPKAPAPSEEVVEIEPKAALQARLAQVQQEIRRRSEKPEGAPVDPSIESSDAATRIVALETEWARLNRERTEARERFSALDARQFAASITASSLSSGRAARILIIDPANLPSAPTGTSKKRVLLAGIAGAMFLGVLMAFGLALIDDHVYDRRDLDGLALAPVLVEVPRFRKASRKARA